MVDIKTPFQKLLRAARLQATCGTQQFLEARREMLQVILPGIDLTDEIVMAAPRLSKEWLDTNCPPEKWTPDQVEAIAYRIYSDARTDGGRLSALNALEFFDHGIASLAAQKPAKVTPKNPKTKG